MLWVVTYTRCPKCGDHTQGRVEYDTEGEARSLAALLNNSNTHKDVRVTHEEPNSTTVAEKAAAEALFEANFVKS